MPPVSSASAAPASHRQPSRKGKKAWRKNVDLRPVEQGLASARDQYARTGGTLLADAPSDLLFTTDTAGDADVRARVRAAHGTLKADQILAARSRVPAVTTLVRGGETSDGALKRKRGEKLSWRELERLRKLAFDRNLGHRDVVDVVENADHDPWTAPVPEPLDPNQSFLEKLPPVKEPKTLHREPETLDASGKAVPNLRKPNPGRSYNPAFDDWSALLEREGAKEVEAEKRRLAAEADQAARDEAILQSAREAEANENADNEALSEYESEWEGFQSEADVEKDVLTAKRPQRKTPQERKKADRRKKQEARDKHDRKMKAREQQEKQIETLIKQAKARKDAGALAALSQPDSDADADEDDGADETLAKRPRFGKRFAPPERSLELVLPDELQDSLRGLRPEGNLLKDRFRNYILQGKVEARKPTVPKKAKNRKETELWTYKDWQLPGQAY